MAKNIDCTHRTCWVFSLLLASLLAVILAGCSNPVMQKEPPPIAEVVAITVQPRTAVVRAVA
jgi:hypothetical protein